MGIFFKSDEEKRDDIKNRNKKIEQKENGLVPIGKQNKFKKTMARIGAVLFGSVILSGGIAGLSSKDNNSKKAKAEDERPTISNEDKEVETQKTIEEDIRETLKESTNLDIKIEQETEPQTPVQVEDYTKTPQIEDLGENIDEVVHQKKEEVGLKDDEETPNHPVQRETTDKSKTMQEQETNIVTPEKKEKENETKKVEVKVDDNKKIEVEVDKDVNVKIEQGTIKTEGELESLKIEVETELNIENEHDNGDITPQNPFEDDFER